jgi:hypothetical protein
MNLFFHKRCGICWPAELLSASYSTVLVFINSNVHFLCWNVRTLSCSSCSINAVSLVFQNAFVRHESKYPLKRPVASLQSYVCLSVVRSVTPKLTRCGFISVSCFAATDDCNAGDLRFSWLRRFRLWFTCLWCRTLKTEAVCSSETLVTTCKTTRHYNQPRRRQSKWFQWLQSFLANTNCLCSSLLQNPVFLFSEWGW